MRLVAALLLATGLAAAPLSAGAKTYACKGSAQTAEGVATAMVATDGKQVEPIRADFAFPPAHVVLTPKAAGYALTTPSRAPPRSASISISYELHIDDKGLRMTLGEAEIVGPGFTRPGGAASQPVFILGSGDDGMLREEAVDDGGILSLRLFPNDGPSTKGDVHLPAAGRLAFAAAFDGTRASVLFTAVDQRGTADIIYQAAIRLTPNEGRMALVSQALTAAAEAAKTAAMSKDCQSMG